MTKRTLKEAWHARKIDMIQERPDSDFGVNFSTIQFYAIEHKSKLNYWIKPKLYQKISELCFYVGVKLQMNRSSEKTCNIGQNMLYEFCYLLFFLLVDFLFGNDLFPTRMWKLFFLESSSFTRIFNGL
jgi:hypothetical protein